MRHPFPCNIRKECNHASDILSLFKNCKGVAIATVAQLSIFLGGIKGGSGVVLKHNPKTDEWSDPTAFGLVGGMFGIQFGLAAIDLVMILTTDSAVKAFARGNVTLGGEIGCAIGPHGRTAEADIAIMNLSPVITYSFTRGLLFSLSVEGIGIIQRNDANKKFYGANVEPLDVLNGFKDLSPVKPQGAISIKRLHKSLRMRAQGEDFKADRASQSGDSGSVAPARPKPTAQKPTTSSGGSSYKPKAYPTAKASSTSSPNAPTTTRTAGGYTAAGYTAKPYGVSAPSAPPVAAAATAVAPPAYGNARGTSTYGNSTSAYGSSTYGHSKSTYGNSNDYNSDSNTYGNSSKNYGNSEGYSSSSHGVSSMYPPSSSPKSSHTSDTYGRSSPTSYNQSSAYNGDYGGDHKQYLNPDYGKNDNHRYDGRTSNSSYGGQDGGDLNSKGVVRPQVRSKPVKATCIYEYEAEEEGDLTMDVDDVIFVTKRESEWWTGTNQRTKKKGIFPSTYVSVN
eukprot:CFRG8163T1